MAGSKPQTTKSKLPHSIIVGVDADGQSDDAVNAALWLARKFDTAVELVHAFPVAPLFWGNERTLPEWTQGTAATRAAIRARLNAGLARVPKTLELPTSIDELELHIESGPAAQVILDRARASQAELIVLGTHRRRGALDFGSTARAVLAHAPVGVWTQPEPLRAIGQILVPIDLSEDSLKALAVARDFARSLAARITVVHCFVEPQLAMIGLEGPVVLPSYDIEEVRRSSRADFERALKDFDWQGVPFTPRFEQGDPAERILALQDSVDLIVMGTHGHTGFSAMLLGNVAYSVLRAARRPVLAIRHAERKFLA